MVVVGLIIVFYVINRHNRHWDEEYESSINGIVKEIKYIGKGSHLISVILSNGKSTDVDILGSYDITIGDSICKKTKTNYYLLYKKNALHYELADSIGMRYRLSPWQK